MYRVVFKDSDGDMHQIETNSRAAHLIARRVLSTKGFKLYYIIEITKGEF